MGYTGPRLNIPRPWPGRMSRSSWEKSMRAGHDKYTRSGEDRVGRELKRNAQIITFGSFLFPLHHHPPPMPSVRVKRRHAYSSIQDDDRYRPEQLHDNQLESGRRALSEPGSTLSPSAASGSLPPPVPPHDPSQPSQNPPVPRRDMSRVNRLTRRSSVSYRSFAADLDSNPADSPRMTYGQFQDSPIRETLLEGASTTPAVTHPHRAHPQRVSRVRSALSSSQSDSHRDSDSDSEYDSEDEDGIMEDDEHHHDDHVVDHLDVIGPSPSHVFPSISILTLLLHRPPSCHGRDSYEHCERYSSVISPFLITSMFQLTLRQPTPLVLQSPASRYPPAWARAGR